MRKVAVVFIVAVFVPSLMLAWLAVGSLRDQQLVTERQSTLLYQGVADALAKSIQSELDGLHRAFIAQVGVLLDGQTPRDAASAFDDKLRTAWKFADVGFVVSVDGSVLSPSMFSSPEARQFRVENDRFFCSAETVQVYYNSPKGLINLSHLDQKAESERQAAERASDGDDELSGEKLVGSVLKGKAPRVVLPAKEPPPNPALSRVAAEEAAFRELVSGASEGALARFLQNKLKLLFWVRAPSDPLLLFGTQVNLSRLIEVLKPFIRVDPPLDGEIRVALLDDLGRPVALSHPDFQADWKRPFVATEIGEKLPHWETAVYLRDSARIQRSARILQMTIGPLIALLVLAIGIGSWLIVADLRRQLALTRQKTDFVSNVSHELKTPLTSIRMFSELLAEGRIHDESKRLRYLHIITAETSRLTRLINNVLDFARLERGEQKYKFQNCDLPELVRATLDPYRPHLEAEGYQLECELPNHPLWVHGDTDALAQVLVNLISNAEKYGGAPKKIRVDVTLQDGMVETRILDRGPGVPPGFEEKIFEQFVRANDSLASGIQGSGLGLTLARQIARAHGGDVVFRRREGGGSCFALCLRAVASERVPCPPKSSNSAAEETHHEA